MTKKHFVQFAEYIRTFGDSEETRRAMAQMVIHVARRDNPRFDTGRFLSACGL